DPPPIAPPTVEAEESYDLIIIAYQVWFLSPSPPITAFLNSEAAKRLLAGKPVVTVIACRNMWIMAQEKMKILLAKLGAHLIDNVVLTDRGGLATFITTPYWLLTGSKKGVCGLPEPGIARRDIEGCERFGRALARGLARDDERHGKAMLAGLRAAEVD